jgi:putative methyltransferase (TIGR04325 family)
MTLFARSLRSILQVFSGLLNKLAHIVSSPLTYTPTGWDTVIPDGKDAGWDSESVSRTEGDKWSEFRTAVDDVGPLGFSHEHSDLADTGDVYHHNVSITYGYVLARAAQNKTSLSILDYGGGLGHYYQIGKILLPDLELKYFCKELPQTARLGKDLNPEIHWFTDDSCLDRTYDLVMVSGSLQYIRYWQQFLQKASAATGSYLFLTRVPVVNNAGSFVAVQRAYGTRMLHWQFNRAELLQAISSTGLTMVREFLAGDCPYIKGAPEQCDLRGWLLQKCPPARR